MCYSTAMPVGDDSPIIGEYRAIQLSRSFLERLYASVPAREREAVIDRVRINTFALFELMCKGHEFTSQEEQEWRRRIKAGNVDADAILVDVREHQNGVQDIHQVSPPIIAESVHYGASGDGIIAALLDAADDPMGNANLTTTWPTTLKTVYKRAMDTGSLRFAKTVFSHPRIDMNQPIDADNRRFVELVMPFMENSLYGEAKEKNKVLKPLFALALEHGALLSDIYYPWRTQQGTLSDYFKLNPFKAYFEQAEKDWTQFENGELRPETLTPLQLGRFYSLGKLEEALAVQRWHGHQDDALLLYDQLPQFVRDSHPCELQRTALIFTSTPPATCVLANGIEHCASSINAAPSTNAR